MQCNLKNTVELLFNECKKLNEKIANVQNIDVTDLYSYMRFNLQSYGCDDDYYTIEIDNNFNLYELQIEIDVSNDIISCDLLTYDSLNNHDNANYKTTTLFNEKISNYDFCMNQLVMYMNKYFYEPYEREMLNK